MANYPFQSYGTPGYNGYGQPVQPMYPQRTDYYSPAQPVPSSPAQPMNSVNTQPAFVCSPVTSREEAVAYRVEAFGPAVIMPDFGHGMIYFKRFNNNTALADFAEFKYMQPADTQEQPETPAAPAIDYGAIVGAFTSRLEGMEKKIDAITGLLENVPQNKPEKPVAAKGGAKE